MTIMSRATPESADAFVADELQAVSRSRGRGDFNTAAADAGGGASVPTGAGLPLYGMPLAALTEAALSDGSDAALGEARQLGWRYLISDARGPKIVDMLDQDGGKPAAMVIKGSLVDRFGKAGALAEEDAPDRLFEARVLDFGRLGMSELWLHCEDGPDVFYSLATPEPSRREASEVLGEAGDRARRQARLSDGGGGKSKRHRKDDRGG
ncbi:MULTISPECIES: hypothetical protein [unclassified Sphingomonas]|uniref:hypothetical protein n=1 Tax=unclassified Sphingomonas TaxID=196159 RepID=UPI00177CB6C9|nr:MULTISPECIES: hypothetical protein [unclassified Sphingomonas]MBD8637861.1 hypothetical protein [Sphingomonas sp. CFBP 13733]MBD8700596.1 hypothetical protein [Sphingomonas sp. CFBP 13714]MBP2511754.1 hypothetical protein [Sphingomonas sp. PvP018]